MYSNVERTRWLRVAVGTVMMLCLGTLYAWSIFRAPFGALYPSWTTADLSMNFTISMVCYSAGGFLGGKLSKKTSNTVTALAAAVLIFAGFLGCLGCPPIRKRQRSSYTCSTAYCPVWAPGLGITRLYLG